MRKDFVERRKKIQDPSGNWVEGVQIDIEESIERFSELKLRDGTILKVKMSVIEAIRLDDKKDEDGNPTYILKSQNIVDVFYCPDELKMRIQ